MSTTHPEMLDPRQAGNVQRYHTWPHHRPQCVANHSWNVARLLLAWQPDVPRHMLIHALMHDIGERMTGDLPYPIKKDNPALKREIDRLEYEGHLAMCAPWQVPAPVALSEAEAELFKLADLTDMWEFSLDELARGNRYCELVRQRTYAAICERLHTGTLDKSVQVRAQLYIQRRMKHEREQHNGSQ